MLSRLSSPVRRPDSWWVIQNPLRAAVHHARVIALATVLVGISALIPGTRLHAQQPLADLPLDELRVLAEQGNAEAQNSLGTRVPDSAEAGRWYRLAAEQGHARGQFNLGDAYFSGWGVPKDEAEAVRWWHLAAEQGGAEEQLRLGIKYSYGRGVPRDHAEALRWMRLAADQGLADAEYRLGLLFLDSLDLDSLGVSQDDAVRWRRSADHAGTPLRTVRSRGDVRERRGRQPG